MLGIKLTESSTAAEINAVDNLCHAETENERRYTLHFNALKKTTTYWHVVTL